MEYTEHKILGKRSHIMTYKFKKVSNESYSLVEISKNNSI